MKLERYELKTESDLMSFEFVSEGPKGKISKLIQYSKTQYANIYNLSFGDKDPITGKIDDTIITNNGDSWKILNTIASTVYTFLDRYSEAWIYAQGSNKTRTRLYRIGLAKNLNEIMIDFELYGIRNSEWQKFEKNMEYDAYLLRKK
jgi:hypothetical protein